ncbi:hypothetical protein ACJJTC_010721 [Scirpophaga incertulas]
MTPGRGKAVKLACVAPRPRHFVSAITRAPRDRHARTAITKGPGPKAPLSLINKKSEAAISYNKANHWFIVEVQNRYCKIVGIRFRAEKVKNCTVHTPKPSQLAPTEDLGDRDFFPAAGKPPRGHRVRPSPSQPRGTAGTDTARAPI